MKTLCERDWEFVGVSAVGLVFHRKGYEEYCLTAETVRFVRQQLTDVYLSVKNGNLVVESNHRTLTPSDFKHFGIEKLVEAGQTVLQL